MVRQNKKSKKKIIEAYDVGCIQRPHGIHSIHDGGKFGTNINIVKQRKRKKRVQNKQASGVIVALDYDISR